MIRPTHPGQLLAISLAVALCAGGLTLTAALTGDPGKALPAIDGTRPALEAEAAGCLAQGSSAEPACAQDAGTGTCEAAAPGDAALDPPAKKPPRSGWCRCSCGQPCTSSADCGGASCDRFITCC